MLYECFVVISCSALSRSRIDRTARAHVNDNLTWVAVLWKILIHLVRCGWFGEFFGWVFFFFFLFGVVFFWNLELCDGVAGGYDWQRIQQLAANVRCGSVE